MTVRWPNLNLVGSADTYICSVGHPGATRESQAFDIVITMSDEELFN